MNRVKCRCGVIAMKRICMNWNDQVERTDECSGVSVSLSNTEEKQY
jgi:hypothetical protein